ncbi:hypothetical protein [Chondromyces apiculatus]|uniref:Uncharacterized protein n=1 Tax=Chondromyces apiculatus DSM 436 TaxID=1192034 RepID=A0A017T8P2_9BACT|nr:hypothetical protein [Chondromyces apiculatus]EYF05180.1 Hypothetical protein CAP_3545 [Chondromyces apiculatus DSM 436]
MAKSDSRSKRPDGNGESKRSAKARDDAEDPRDDASDAEDEARNDAESDADEARNDAEDENAGEAGGKAKAQAGTASTAASREGRPRAKATRRVGPKPVPPPPLPAQGGALGKSLLLFVLIVGGLAAAFAVFGQETGGRGAVNWKPGSKPLVEITLVASDRRDLACWSPQEVSGKHCGFQAPAQPWPNGDPNDDKTTLRPYTTVDGVQFLAAGVWSDPALAGNLPLGRFSVKCTLNVEGNVKRPSVRWSSEGAWLDQTNDWMAGHVTSCKLIGSTP